MIDIYNIGTSPEEIRSALIDLRNDFDSHNHDGTSSKKFQTLEAETISARAILVRKTSFSDTTSGIWMGLVGNVMKLKLGTATAYVEWTGTALNIVGSISGSTITGGTFQTATVGQRIVIASSDNSFRVFDSAGQVIGIGSTAGTAINVDLNATTVTGMRIVGGTAGTGGIIITSAGTAAMVAFDYTNSSNTASRGINLTLTGATQASTAMRIDHDGNGGEAIFIQNTAGAKGIYLELSGTAQGIYITQSSTGLGIEVIKSGTGIVASFESSNANLSTSAVYITSNSTDSSAAALHVNRTGSHTVIKATQSVNSSDRLYGLHLNLANAGSGVEAAFRFEGSEYDGAPAGVATFVGVIKVFPDTEGSVCFVPVYSATT